MKQSLDKYFLRYQKRMMEARERAELLGRAVCKFNNISFLVFYFLTLAELLCGI